MKKMKTLLRFGRSVQHNSRERLSYFRQISCQRKSVMYSRTSLRKVIRDLYGGGPGGNFERDKIIARIEKGYYWLQLGNDVTTIVRSCPVCQVAKGQAQNMNPYPSPKIVGKT